MAYVGFPFAHDLFVSYSHGSDRAGKTYFQSWSAGFVEALKDELKIDRKLRDTLDVFLDTDHRPGLGVDPMSALTDQLQDSIGDSALLMVLMSEDYLASSWCTKEREWWYTEQEKHGLPVDGRIAVVNILPTLESWPTQFLDKGNNRLPGFTFYQKIANTDRPIGWIGPGEGFKSQSQLELLSIVSQLIPRLNELQALLQERESTKEDATRLTDADNRTLYLHGRADQRKIWDKAGLALTASGYSVVPGEPDAVKFDPQNINKVREQRVELLSTCDALLLLGTADGRALDADLVVVGKHDRQSARARSNRLLPCGLLNTVGSAIATPVRNATARIFQADWIDGTEENWTPRVGQWLKEKSTQLEPRP